MSSRDDHGEMKLGLREKAFLAATVILPLVLSGCTSTRSGNQDSILTGDDSLPVWQNAGTTPPVAQAAAPAPSTPSPPPPNTLESGITTVGGPVSTKPGYAEYDFGWPRIYISDGATNTLYQPQVRAWTNMVLEARAAVSIQAVGMADPTFGILDLKVLTRVDKVERMVYFEDIQIIEANFPTVPGKKAEYTAAWLALLKENVRSV